MAEQQVSMKARVTTDGNVDDWRRRIVNAQMDVDKILQTESLKEAIKNFKEVVYYIDEVEDLEYFEVDGQQYDASFWK